MENPNWTSESQRVARALIVSLALLFAVASQLTLHTIPEALWLGLLLSVMAVLLFLESVLRVPSAWIVTLVTRLSLSYTSVLVGLALTLSLLSTVFDQIWSRLNRTNYTPILVLWVGSLLVYLWAFAAPVAPWAQWRSWLRQYRGEIVGLLFITLVGAVLRFYQLGAMPRVIDGDEGLIGQFALTTNQNPLASPFALFENFGSLYLQAIATALAVIGQAPFALRLMPAIAGTVAVPAVYLFGRGIAGRPVAFIAAVLIALSHGHIHFSRIVSVAYIQSTWLVPLELYFFLTGLQKRIAFRLALGGLLLGLHFNIYLGAQIVAAMLVVYTLLAVWLCRPLIQQVARVAWAFWLGAIVAALPMLVFVWFHPNEFVARLNSDGTFQSGWLGRTMAETGQSALQILAGRVAHAFLSLIYYPARDFYGVSVPLLDWVSGALFILGLAYAFSRTRDARYLLLNGYFWSLTVAIGIFALPPSADSYRMLATLPAVCLIAAIGLEQIFTNVILNEVDRRPVHIGVTTFLLIAVATLNLRTYFVDFAQHCLYGGDLQTRFASYLGNYLRGVDHDATVYLLSDDAFHYGTHSSSDFLGQNHPVTNLPESVANVTPRPQTIVVATPNRMDELQDWIGGQTGGHLIRQSDCSKPILLAYEIP